MMFPPQPPAHSPERGLRGALTPSPSPEGDFLLCKPWLDAIHGFAV
ncbi:MAG: hypothetical protein IKJ80_03455 [Clostridia bacterium]|nr:hypothetical protein [Clostridia bacterium]